MELDSGINWIAISSIEQQRLALNLELALSGSGESWKVLDRRAGPNTPSEVDLVLRSLLS